MRNYYVVLSSNTGDTPWNYEFFVQINREVAPKIIP